MPDVGFLNLFAVALVAFGVPLLLGLAPWLRVPGPVLEIVAGVVLGPAVLGWVDADLPVRVLAVVGLAFLLFLAGLEIDVSALRGRPLRLALAGFGITLVLGVLAGGAFAAAGWVHSPLLLAITLSATSLGLVVPVLKDAGQTERPIGQAVVVAASVADVGAVLLLSLFFSTRAGTGTGARLVLLAGFALVVAVLAWALLRAGRSPRLGQALLRQQDTTAEIRVRACVALLLGLVAVASRFGLETILGAFVAGAVLAFVDRDATSHPRLRAKLDAVGYGFVVPVFFVASGLRLDVRGLLADPAALARVPVFLVALLLVRGAAALPLLPTAGRRATAAAGLLQATSLPFILTATQIGVATAVLSPVTAAALVAAGLLSVLLFPATALVQLRRRPSEYAVAPSRESEAQVHPCGGTAGAGLGRTIRL
ncbi:MAG TPA: cation:proton antiporter [Kineosporiaceae bacterium]|nr:cation:proton antiporter [Kineosporiaceae bacterium]